MQLPLICLLAVTLALTAGTAKAGPLAPSTLNSSIRALGMGDAFTAVANDHTSLFYNPAGLAKVRGINWRLFAIGGGGSGVEAYEKVTDIQSDSSDDFSEAIGALYGETASVNFSGESVFTMPLFGFGVYNHTMAQLRVNNPVYPALQTTFVNDYGYVMGVGLPLGLVHWGLDLKYIKRTGADTVFGPSSVADLDSEAITSRLTQWGVGYGADMGASLVIPTPILSATVSAVWKNMGQTHFRSESLSEIPYDDNEINFGTALEIDLPLLTITPAVDVRYLNRSDLQLMRKVNFGIEIDLPLLDIRGGFREGYYTAGVGVDLGLFRVDAATYGVELGAYPGQLEDRRYVVEFAMQLGFGNFSLDGRSPSSAKGGGSGSSGRGRSLFGGRLKQRR